MEEGTVARSYPACSATEPLLLFNKSSTSVALAPEPEPPKFPVFPNIVSVENDASQAKVPDASHSHSTTASPFLPTVNFFLHNFAIVLLNFF